MVLAFMINKVVGCTQASFDVVFVNISTSHQPYVISLTMYLVVPLFLLRVRKSSTMPQACKIMSESVVNGAAAVGYRIWCVSFFCI